MKTNNEYLLLLLQWSKLGENQFIEIFVDIDWDENMNEYGNL